MKLLTIDIETSPNVAHVWGLWQQNVSLNQLRESGQVICWAAKWYGKKGVEFRSDFHDGHEAQIQRAWELMSEADALIHFNGNSFDVPWLEAEFVTAGLEPPAPHVNIDLLRVVKKRFRFPSNKLQYVSTRLGLPGKVQHSGHDLWVRCLQGDEKAWNTMRRYNKQDVVLTEQLFDTLRPWITGLPNPALYGEDGEPEACGCGNTQLQQRGYAYTTVSRYLRYQCVGDNGCGRWLRGGKRDKGVDLRGIS